jgi:sporulation protein YlmC with PRC-barrel domain
MRKLLMTTAIALVAASGAMAAETTAETTTQPMTGEYMQGPGEAALASSLIGETVYASTEPGAEAVGDIDNLVIADDGTVKAVVIGVGGFLGVGEKSVAVSYESIHWAKDESGNEFAIYEASKESLQEAPEFMVEQTAMAPAGDDMTMDEAKAPRDEKVMDADSEMAADQQQGSDEEMMAESDASTMPQLADITRASVSAGDLLGSTVYAFDDQDVGEVGDLRLSMEGNIDAAIVDVGGFLGLGEKPVAIAFDSLRFKTDETGRVFVYTEFTREELEAAPDYNEAAYDDERDTMRLTMR